MEELLLVHSPVATISLSSSGQLLQIHNSIDEELLESLKDRMVICDNSTAAKKLAQAGIKTKLQLNHPELKIWRLNRFEQIKQETGQIVSYKEYKKKIRDNAINKTREGVKANAAKSDEIVAQIIHAIDDLQKSSNLAANRLSELYSLHFPELVSIISNVITLARIIVDQPERDKIDSTLLKKYGIPKGKIELIIPFTKNSLGGEIGSDALQPVQDYAETLITLYEKQRKLENWVDNSLEGIAPNLTAVAGPNVSARLISAMGSLRALALKSSSKIQIIGAEKALYSSLKSGGPPPKHGIIFQIPEIGNSPYWIRGKISRAFAAKIVIAARIDYFEGEFIGDKMRADLREFEAELRKKFPNPPPQKAKPKPQSKKSRGKYQRRRKN